MKPKISILVTGIFVMIIFVSVSYSQHPNQMEAREWMQLSMEYRTIFCFGFLAGFNEFANTFGVETRTLPSRSRPLTSIDISEMVYKRLLENPELRSGPIGAIILNVISSFVTFTDRTGKPLKRIE